MIKVFLVRYLTEAMQTPPEEYDIVGFGSGEAGKYIAWLPSKNIIHSSKVASYFWRSAEFGISKDNTRIDMASVRDRKRKMVEGMIQVHLDNFKASGAELVIGSGRFIGPKTI